MKRIRIVGLCLVAVFAFSAIAASSAMAEEAPFFMKCVKTVKNGEHKYTGTYTEKECNTAATPTQITAGVENAYALEKLPVTPAVPVAGKSKSVVITTKGNSGNWQVIVCGGSTVTGAVYDTVYGGKWEEVTGTFSKCVGKSNGTEAVCSNAEPEVGKPVIQFKATGIAGEANWLEAGETGKASLTVGGAPTFTCGGEAIEMHGVLNGALENTSKGMNLTWTVGGASRSQSPSEYWEAQGEELNESFFYTRWYTGAEEVEEESETTVAGIEALKPETKGVSVRKAGEAS